MDKAELLELMRIDADVRGAIVDPLMATVAPRRSCLTPIDTRPRLRASGASGSPHRRRGNDVRRVARGRLDP